jgi:hypothetical protein
MGMQETGSQVDFLKTLQCQKSLHGTIFSTNAKSWSFEFRDESAVSTVPTARSGFFVRQHVQLKHPDACVVYIGLLACISSSDEGGGRM